MNHLLSTIRNTIQFYPDFPKPGVNFLDIMPLFRNPQLIDEMCEQSIIILKEKLGKEKFSSLTSVGALEARGFLFGPLIAAKLGISFVPIRKKGKLPGMCHSVTYDLEYGSATIELQATAFNSDDHILIVDDLIATGGTLLGAIELTHKAGAKVEGVLSLFNLKDLPGSSLISKKHSDIPLICLCDL